jgi:hypothetical protein
MTGRGICWRFCMLTATLQSLGISTNIPIQPQVPQSTKPINHDTINQTFLMSIIRSYFVHSFKYSIMNRIYLCCFRVEGPDFHVCIGECNSNRRSFVKYPSYAPSNLEAVNRNWDRGVVCSNHHSNSDEVVTHSTSSITTEFSLIVRENFDVFNYRTDCSRAVT